MGFQKGKSGNPSGRPKGSKNRSTAAVRDSLAILVENNIENMQEWLERMAEDDPKAAYQCLLATLEFHVPKRTRIHCPDDYQDETMDKPVEKFDAVEAVKRALEAVEKEYG